MRTYPWKSSTSLSTYYCIVTVGILYEEILMSTHAVEIQ